MNFVYIEIENKKQELNCYFQDSRDGDAFGNLDVAVASSEDPDAGDGHGLQ